MNDDTADKDARDTLLQKIYLRVGELVSLLAAIDAATLSAILHLQTDVVLFDYATNWPFDQRVALLRRLLVARKAAESVCKSFDSVIGAIKPVMDRRAIIAHNMATLQYDQVSETFKAGVAKWKDFVRDTGQHDGYLHPLEEIERDCATTRELLRQLTACNVALYARVPGTYPKGLTR
jgi:hypothetical protein